MDQKGFSNIALIVIVVVILAGVAGYFTLVKKSPEIVRQTTTPTRTQTQTSKSPTPSDKTATWKIYRDEKYGFTFKYPPEYSININSHGNSPTFSDPGNKHFYTYVTFTTQDAKLAWDGGIAPLPERSTHSTIENINGHNWQKDYSSGGYYLIYSLRTDGIAIGFSILDDSQTNMLKQIVSTFQSIQLPYQRLDKVLYALKIGDMFGPFKVSSIQAGIRSKLISADNFKVQFIGQTTLRGHYYAQGDISGTLICIDTLDSNSLNLLPQLEHDYDYKNASFCFDHDNFFANSQVKDEEGNAGIVMDNLVESFDMDGPSFEAHLISVLK